MRNAMLIHVWVLCLGLGLALGVQGADLETGLVARWKFDETEGTAAHDSSGNGHNGVLSGGPKWSSGHLAGALHFDGVDDVVRVPYSAALNPPDAFTVAAWAGISSPQPLCGLISSRGLDPPRGFCITTGDTVWNFGIGNGTQWYSVQSSSSSLGKWVHLTAVYSEGTQRFYVDGILMDESSATLQVNEGQELLIGALSGPAGDSGFFPGDIDEVRIYNRALSENEVVSLVANDAFRASFELQTWEDEYGEDHTTIGLVFPWNGWRYALEVSDTSYGLWRRANNNTFVGFDYDIYGVGGIIWGWTVGSRIWSMRVAVESRTPAFGELEVLVNPTTSETVPNPNRGTCVSNVSDEWAIRAGFRPLGTRLFGTQESDLEPKKGDHATWMVKPSGGSHPLGSPICEVEFEGHPDSLWIWRLKPVEPGYVALGDYCDVTGIAPPEGSPYRPVAVRADLVYNVDPGHWWGIESWEGDTLYVIERPLVDPAPQDAKLFNPARFLCYSCKDQHLYMLRLPLPQSVRRRRTADELITFGPLSQPNDLSTIYTSHIVTVPYTEVKDPRPLHDRNWQSFFSPFYILEREEAFQLMQTVQNEGTFQYTDTQGTSTEVAQSYWQSSAFTVDLNVGIQVKAVDVSGGISVTKEMGWETSQAFSSMREKSVSYSTTVWPGEFAGLWFRCYRLIQRDALGQAVNPNPEWMVDPNSAVFTYWPPR